MGRRRAHLTLATAAAVLGLAFALRARPAAALIPAPPAEAQIEVQASPGPALWVAIKGAAELVMLGTVSPMPQAQEWNTRRVAEALRGARVLLLSPGSVPGLAWAENFSNAQRYFLGQPIGRTLSQELDPAVETGLEQRAADIREPQARYGGYRPGPAGMVLLEDSWRARRFEGAEAEAAVVALARAQHVRVEKVDEGGALPLIDAMPSMSRAEHAACIAEALQQFDWEGAHVAEAARAWAQGDVRELHRAYRPTRLCADSIPGGANRRRQARLVWLRALERALQAPGRTVVLMDVSELLEPSDVLADLRDQGAVVTEPLREAEAGGRVLASGGRPVLTPGVVDAKPLIADLTVTAVNLPTLATPAPRGRTVGLQDELPVCVTDTPIGSLLPQTVCRSAAEWKEIRAERELQNSQWRSRMHGPGVRSPPSSGDGGGA